MEESPISPRLPFDAKEIEVWIYQQHVNRHQTAFIADELLKFWEKKLLLFEAKQSAGKFCLLNGYFAPLIRALKVDLRSGDPLQWSLILEVLISEKIPLLRNLVDACLAGASRDRQLLEVSATALTYKSEDPRWEKIFASEIKERQSTVKGDRDKLFQDIKIFQQEGMAEALKESVFKVLSLYPDDKEAQKINQDLKEKEIDRSLAEIKKNQLGRRAKPLASEKVDWPNLDAALNKAQPDLDIETAYNLSIGLSEMGFFENSLTVLRSQKSKWSLREEILELELTLSMEHYAEALELTQELMRHYSKDPHVMQTLLYNMAKSHQGLEDFEQAISIMRALTLQNNGFKDAAVLLREWEQHLA